MDGSTGGVVFATCETVDCGNYLQPMEFTFPDGEEVTVMCGVCGVPVTDITNYRPSAGTELPEWISQMLQTQSSAD